MQVLLGSINMFETVSSSWPLHLHCGFVTLSPLQTLIAGSRVENAQLSRNDHNRFSTWPYGYTFRDALIWKCINMSGMARVGQGGGGSGGGVRGLFCQAQQKCASLVLSPQLHCRLGKNLALIFLCDHV